MENQKPMVMAEEEHWFELNIHDENWIMEAIKHICSWRS
jgi:hypothetical protein